MVRTPRNPVPERAYLAALVKAAKFMAKGWHTDAMDRSRWREALAGRLESPH